MPLLGPLQMIENTNFNSWKNRLTVQSGLIYPNTHVLQYVIVKTLQAVICWVKCVSSCVVFNECRRLNVLKIVQGKNTELKGNSYKQVRQCGCILNNECSQYITLYMCICFAVFDLTFQVYKYWSVLFRVLVLLAIVNYKKCDTLLSETWD